MEIQRRWLTIAETAALLSINPKTASAWALSGRLPAVRIGGRGPWRVDRRRLEESLESQIKNIGSAGCLGGGAPRRRGACPALYTRGQHERGGQE
ncbi:MAG: helix-turn-helix domain-containing protein [Candidatus Aminicenantes bacterium]|nr:helix-turn-helix domain-containing protein [Candidatus Aminicenantes bacterium]